jgi:hypothetical protein
MKKRVESLRLRRETVANLNPNDLPTVAGGSSKTIWPSICTRCTPAPAHGDL